MKIYTTIFFTLLLVLQAFCQDQHEISEEIHQQVEIDQDTIIDPQNILSSEQVEQIKAEQKLFQENHQCIVSYALYGIHHTQLEVQRAWKDSIASDDEQFHLLISIGSFLENHNIDIQFVNPPLLDDINEVENILESSKQNIQSESSLEDILNQSFIRINDDLTYFSTRPMREKDQSDKILADQNRAFKNYITKIIKIALAIITPLILLYIAWNFYNYTSNKKPYRFPETKSPTRLGAPHGSTSITQTNR